ncbi:hypothetical protein AVEN_195668-1 [Araneus ventricosus]|uniref:Tc1-like transposase DDE domain-containing protein n=1 Tax=Araneus ventricosus TaxID=182803 RepID=A0A4Y2BBG4_ARAVE|nr:hypothetical protein AVEN_195668-1 [Araneus ventricosus]
MGFGSRRPTRVPLLNARHRAALLARAREHRERTLEDWERVVWRNESGFRLLHVDGRMTIWRQAHEAMEPACQVGIVQGHGDSIIVWGVFSWQFFGIFGTCTNLPHCDSVRRVAGRSPPSIFVVLSSTWKWSNSERHMHLSQVQVGYWLDEHSSGFSVMNCPPRSPVLNPIEHLWMFWRKV